MITVVSGLPRSGTSLMMQMLEAAGLEIHCDGQRLADADNPRGYFELEKAKRLSEDASFLEESRGRVVKVVAPLLHFLPSELEYRVIFMERDLGEVMASQQAMMKNAGRCETSEATNRALERAFRKRIEQARHWLDDSRNIQVCYVSHRLVLSSPGEASIPIMEFLERTGVFVPGSLLPEDREQTLSRMSGVVDGDLFRQRT